jgi:cyclohexanone monooxygenase
MARVDFDAVIVGAGLAGLYMLHRLREAGMRARVFEAGSGIGGTWFWNRYPGARCDIESVEYSYQFSEELQQEWEWSERYATQPEILRYIEHVADRFALRDGIQLDTRVEAAEFDEALGLWNVRTDRDTVTARFCIMATGCLSCANTPDLPGLDDFEGDVFHTGRWPHEGVDFTGQRVAVIGTGSSAIQSIPLIAEQAERLTVFQRTPNYTIPAHNGPLDPERVAEIKADYPGFRARNAQMIFGAGASGAFTPRPEPALAVDDDERRREYDRKWEIGGLGFVAAFPDLLLDEEANRTAAEYVRERIREIVDDPEVAERLSPKSLIGCKRLCVDTGYWETFNRPHVSLVDVSKDPIERITQHGLRQAGREHEVDAIVLATGFDAMTGALLRIDIRGVGGQKLAAKWREGPRTYLGLGVAGFPNLFTITGPGSPSVLSNMIPSIEQHVDWIADCMAWLREHGYERIEATPDAEHAWVEHVNAVASQTLYPRASSWYVGANIPGKPRVFMPYIGFPQYVDRCNRVAAAGYEGFALA